MYCCIDMSGLFIHIYMYIYIFIYIYGCIGVYIYGSLILYTFLILYVSLQDPFSLYYSLGAVGQTSHMRHLILMIDVGY